MERAGRIHPEDLEQRLVDEHRGHGDVLVLRIEDRVGGETWPVDQEVPLVEQERDLAGVGQQHRRRGEHGRDQEQDRGLARPSEPLPGDSLSRRRRLRCGCDRHGREI